MIQDILDDYLIIRTTGVYGWERQNKNFVVRLIRSLTQGERVSVPIDQISTPTLVTDLVTITKMLLDKNINGVFHVVGKTYLSRYEFALQVANVFNLNQHLIKPMLTSDLGQSAPRPLQGGLYSIKLDDIMSSKIHNVLDGLNFLKDQ